MSLAAAKPLHFGIHVGALLLTATRGAVVCLVVGVVLYLVAVPPRVAPSRRRWLASAAALLVAAVVWASPLSAVLRNRLFEESLTSGPSFRLIAIETGTAVFRDNLVLGLGFNGFGAARPAVYADWRNPTQAANGLSRTANQYLQTATDGGVLALVLLLLFVACCCRQALRIARSRESSPELAGAQLWLIAVLIGNQGALWLLSDTSTGFFVFAVAGITARVSLLERRRLAGLPGHRPQSLPQ
jgi:O-antigen ligase